MGTARVVSHEEWLKARKAHLAREKEFTRLREEGLSFSMSWLRRHDQY